MVWAVLDKDSPKETAELSVGMDGSGPMWTGLFLSVGHQALETALIAGVDEIALAKASFAFG